MGDLASLVQLSVSSTSQGKFLVTRCEDWTVKPEKKAEVKTEVGNPDGAGVVRKPGGYSITFKVMTEQGDTTMLSRFLALADSQEWIAITKQIVGGNRDQHPECTVSSVDEDGNNQGENGFSVEIVSLKRKGL